MNKNQIKDAINQIEKLRVEAEQMADHYAYLEDWREANWWGGREQAFRNAKEILENLLKKKEG